MDKSYQEPILPSRKIARIKRKKRRQKGEKREKRKKDEKERRFYREMLFVDRTCRGLKKRIRKLEEKNKNNKYTRRLRGLYKKAKQKKGEFGRQMKALRYN